MSGNDHTHQLPQTPVQQTGYSSPLAEYHPARNHMQYPNNFGAPSPSSSLALNVQGGVDYYTQFDVDPNIIGTPSPHVEMHQDYAAAGQQIIDDMIQAMKNIEEHPGGMDQLGLEQIVDEPAWDEKDTDLFGPLTAAGDEGNQLPHNANENIAQPQNHQSGFTLPRTTKRKALSDEGDNQDAGNPEKRRKTDNVPRTATARFALPTQAILPAPRHTQIPPPTLAYNPTPLQAPPQAPLQAPNLIHNGNYTSPTVLLQGYDEQNLPVLCSEIVPSVAPIGRKGSKKDANGNVVTGPQGRALKDIHPDMPDHVSASTADTWQLMLLQDMTGCHSTDLRDRMQTTKSWQGAGNQVSRYRTKCGRLSVKKWRSGMKPSKQCVRAIMHLSDYQIRHNTCWEVDPQNFPGMHRQTNASQWVPIPHQAGDFDTTNDRMRDTLAELRRLRQEALNQGRHQNDFDDLMAKANRGRKGEAAAIAAAAAAAAAAANP
ncbi:hypothetical protein NA57DRAFT_62309 [Rhizodiscina lignyota]|uniref:Uncharacterized protein n=1 Tax=Rhizodiscina lignyota TaxID=1504668 RepID=A0A9P4I5S1_9PEZI|nr:hypothetical protein NA57DRAFT_62309 [Rhizodiscina lignyota]